jgi:radical SAM protein with 4Fe4S-binding SPASM domain
MINVKHILQTDYESVAGADWPSYDDFQNGGDSIDPTIMEEIVEFVNTTKDIYKKGHNYLSRSPYYIDKDLLSDEQAHRLLKSDTFCMLPWVHMHAFPDGRVYPCCLAEYWHPVGDLRKNTMAEVWNQDKYKQIRVNMLEDKPCVECTKCYEREEHGAFSMRFDANRNYGHYISEVDKTHKDGTHPDFKIRYWDVRFSNLCNFRCRSCGPIFSSNWYNDHVKLYNVKPDVLGRPMERIEYATGNEDTMPEQMLEHGPYLEQVYFAGGEPLIMKEHYALLEKLIELGKTDVRIQYNTNFSEMRYKDKHVFEYWKHFTNISVGASLDGMGSQAELIRKGADWKQTVENRERMMAEVPHVDFYVSSTISSMNVLHVLDFHKDWVERGLIQAKDWNINICQSPEWYRCDIFPKEFKERVIYPAYEEHIAWLDPQDSLRRATTGYQSLLSLMRANDAVEHWPRFVEETRVLDGLRKESFWDTFPEFKELQ